MSKKWVIRFEDGEDVWYAADWGQGCGFTFNPDSATRFDDKDLAETLLVHGYGKHMREVATVVKA